MLSAGVMNGMSDCHCHILPGVDDGLKTVADSLDVLAYYEQLGVERVTFTPHLMEDYPQNTSASLREEFLRFKELYKGNIRLELGAEHMIDGSFERHLVDDMPLTLFGNHLLIETSCMYAPANLEDVIHRIRSAGYHVLLAHPERYRYMHSADYKRLHEAGVRFQLNLLSLSGLYGTQVRDKARQLLTQRYYDCAGSDLHRLPPFQKGIAESCLSKNIVREVERLKTRWQDF